MQVYLKDSDRVYAPDQLISVALACVDALSLDNLGLYTVHLYCAVGCMSIVLMDVEVRRSAVEQDADIVNLKQIRQRGRVLCFSRLRRA